MKNFIVCLAIAVVSFCAQAQQVQSVQLPTLSSEIAFGDSVGMRIHNPHDVHVTFFPLFQVGERDIPQDVFFSQETFLGWIAGACENVSVGDCILAMSQRAAPLLKSDIWVNSALYPSFWEHWNNDGPDQSAYEQAFAKNYSMMGVMVGSYSLQCGEYTQIMALALHRNGVAQDNLRIVNSQSHVFGEILHNEKWKIVDFDPGNPNFMTSGHLDHEEVRAIGFPDIMNEEFRLWKYESFFFPGDSLVHNAYRSGQNSVTLNEEWYAYYTAVTDSGMVYDPLFYETYDFESDLILPAGSYLKVEYVNSVFSVDTVLNPELWSELHHNITSAMNAYELQDSVAFESSVHQVVMILANHFNQNPEFIADHLFDGDLVFNAGRWAPVFDRTAIPPYYTIVVAPGYYQIGNDIKAPGKVLSVEASPGSEVHLTDVYGNDTLIVGGAPYEVPFWESENSFSNFIPNKSNHYLRQGWIHATDTVRIRISWNPAIFNFLHGTLELETDQPLDVEYWINGTNVLDTLIVNVDEKKILNVYPNPVSDGVNFPFGDVTLYDMYGRIVSACSNCTSLSVEGFSKGLYILNHTSGNARIMIQ